MVLKHLVSLFADFANGSAGFAVKFCGKIFNRRGRKGRTAKIRQEYILLAKRIDLTFTFQGF